MKIVLDNFLHYRYQNIDTDLSHKYSIYLTYRLKSAQLYFQLVNANQFEFKLLKCLSHFPSALITLFDSN